MHPESTDPLAVVALSRPAVVVEEFVRALDRADAAAAVRLLHDDVMFHPAPFPPMRGKLTVARQLEFLAALITCLTIDVHNIATNGGTVLTERTHTLEIGPVPLHFWTWGTFEVRDGRIALWRERIDLAEFSFSAIKGVAHAVSAFQIEPRRN